MNGLSAILLGYGIANFVGTSLAGRVLEHRLRPMLIGMPALMVVLGIALVVLGRAPMIDAVLVALWGMAFGGVPVAERDCWRNASTGAVLARRSAGTTPKVTAVATVATNANVSTSALRPT